MGAPSGRLAQAASRGRHGNVTRGREASGARYGSRSGALVGCPREPRVIRAEPRPGSAGRMSCGLSPPTKPKRRAVADIARMQDVLRRAVRRCIEDRDFARFSPTTMRFAPVGRSRRCRSGRLLHARRPTYPAVRSERPLRDRPYEACARQRLGRDTGSPIAAAPRAPVFATGASPAGLAPRRRFHALDDATRRYVPRRRQGSHRDRGPIDRDARSDTVLLCDLARTKKKPALAGFSVKPTGGLEPPTPSLRVMMASATPAHAGLCEPSFRLHTSRIRSDVRRLA
jgi:hypothetical protein